MQKGRRGLLAEQTHEQIDENLRTHGLLCSGGCQLDWLNNGGIVILGLLTRVEIGHIASARLEMVALGRAGQPRH
jgi:hypothetical protein